MVLHGRVEMGNFSTCVDSEKILLEYIDMVGLERTHVPSPSGDDQKCPLGLSGLLALPCLLVVHGRVCFVLPCLAVVTWIITKWVLYGHLLHPISKNI